MAFAGGGTNSQVWLTYAITDSDVLKALTLCFSMRRVFTSRKLAVIVSRNVSLSMKEVLRYVFDFFFYLEEELNTAGLKEEELVKLSAFTLKGFGKLVFLEPSIFAVKNSDDIFDNNEVTSGLLATEVGQGDTDDGLSIFVARPCLQVFRDLMDSLQTRNGIGAETYLRRWTTDNLLSTPKPLDKKYCLKLSQGSSAFCRFDSLPRRCISYQCRFRINFQACIHMRQNFFGDEADISLVKIDIPLGKATQDTEEFGLCGRIILEQRRKIYDEYVQPLLQPKIDGTISPRLDAMLQLQPSSGCKEPIAIIGMSCRYPKSNNLQEFWNLLLNGEDATGNPPEFRWLREQSIKTSIDGRKTNAGFLKVPVDDFDAKFFGISPKEMVFLDPQHRLLHELVWEGLEDAAINPQSLIETNGSVFIGSWINNYKDILERGGNNDFYRSYMGNSIGAAAARISFLLGMTGPSIATESGCSSAMVAVHLACRALQNGETNLGLACGVNLLLHPFDKDVMPMVMSPSGHCKTFDANADGFARAEGCGVLVLKRLSDAVRDEDKIWALIKGSAVTQEGASKSMGTPTVHCESLAMKLALQDAEVDAAQVSYVEAHGTGTVVGDPMEVAAIAKAYHSNDRKEPLLIGSVKTNVGHTESCSGITGIMKVVLAMNHEVIPAHRNFETLNPAINLNAVPAKIPLQAEEWKAQKGKSRIAGVSSFGITGTDAHAIIAEAPTISPKVSSNLERPLHIMKISAKTEEALDILLENYKIHSSSMKQDEFMDSAYTANIGRSDFTQRAVLIAKSGGEIAEIINNKKFLRGEEEPKEARGNICFLFTGQGSQYPGMAKELYKTSPVFRMHFEYCQNILKNTYNIDISKVLWSDCEYKNEVCRTIYSQTSIFCVEYALLKLWESWGVKADYALGHSLGEFGAAVCANILSVEDSLKLVAERSRLIDKLPGGKMLVIKAAKQMVESLMIEFAGDDLSKALDYAAINSMEQTVVAGDAESILQFAKLCNRNNLKTVVLEATHAFHSKHMDPMLDEYKRVANTIKKQGGNDCKYISGMLGTLISENEVNADYWVQHTREKVSFLEASKKAVELGCKTFIEIGPQPILCALTLMNNNTPLLCLPSLKRNENEWETLLNTLGKLYVKGWEIDWKGVDQFYLRQKVSLPHYPFIGKKFWPDILSVTGATIHPLLGSVISNASPSKIFQNGLNLRALEYVKDHKIGEHVIFPGAGFLEMCLAAGLATIEANTDSLSYPTRAMKVENLRIEAPLSLKESTTCQLQTVAEFNSTNKSCSNHHEDWNDISIKIFRQNASESSTTWHPHAKATFSPLPTCADKEVTFDSHRFLETVKRLPIGETEITQIYEKLASLGLKFGPTFKSIEKVWRDDENRILVAKLNVPDVDNSSSSHNQYIIHPVALDAMIQAVLMLRPISSFKKSLYVPIKIGKFVWLSKASTPELYVHAFQQEKKSLDGSSAILVDSSANIVAIMSGVELVDTTVKALDSLLEQQSTFYPEFWEEVWKKTESPLELSADMELVKGNFLSDEFHQEFEQKYNIPSQQLKETFKHLETFVYLNYLRSLYELGWRPELNQRFCEIELMRQLGIRDEFRQYFGFLCEVFEKEGILKKEDKNENWTVVSHPPSSEKVLVMLQSPELSSSLVTAFNPTLLLQKLGRSMGQVLNGTVSPISILFPEGKKSYPSMAEFYDDYAILFNVIQLRLIVNQQLNHMIKSQVKPEFKVRILEIGAGTGACSERLMDTLEELGIQFEYTYTDISASFFAGAEKRLQKHLKNIKFMKLNIEEDPLTQGLIPDYFDYVYCADVIHATRDIKESLRNIRKVMKPFATLNLIETTRVSRLLTFVVGALEGYWKFQDNDLRPKYCVMEKHVWKQALHSEGFEVDSIVSTFSNHHSAISCQKTVEIINSIEPYKTWLLFYLPNDPISQFFHSKLAQVPGRNVIVVERGLNFQNNFENSQFILRNSEYQDFLSLFSSLSKKRVDIEGIVYCWALDKSVTSQELLLRPYFNLTKSVLNLNKTPSLSLITSGIIPMGDNDLSGFHASTLWSYSKSMRNENLHFNCKCIEIADENLDEIRMQELFYEVWNSDKQNQVAFANNARLVPKYTSHKPVSNDLKVPNGTDRFQLILPETKSISDLQFGSLDPSDLNENEVEVHLKASALNFRDVLSIIKPSEDFKDVNTVGFDFSGVVKQVGKKVTKWKKGDRVFGCNVHFTAMPSHLILDEALLLQLPDSLSYCEGATMSAVYITSILCLIEIAKIKKGDVVLIHTASGGVGLSAIEICKYFGCEIIATAGSKRKQNYLRNLGIHNVFHSRSTQYKDDILKVTSGRGVDVVLNSLTSEGFKEATLKVCAKGARFVEMSKLNIWTKEEVREIRQDIEYTTIDLSQSKMEDWIRFVSGLNALLEKGVVKPIPYVRFDAQNVREALHYMQKAKHIGKIVCVLPQVRMDDGGMKMYTPMFNDTSTYLITGGLGGIGFVVCKWMVEKGAKHILLAGRSPPSPEVKSMMNEMKSKGVNVIPVQLDVGDFEQCKELIQTKLDEFGLPLIKGIMHAAGILSDGLIVNQEWEKLSSTFNPKINGTLNLHELTKHLNLEHFVMFSSIVAVFGPAGQSNHAAASGFEDSFAHYRNSIGLPATTINWGQWGEVGVAKEVDLPGVKTLSSVQGVTGLEYVLKAHRVQTSINNMSSFILLSKVIPHLTSYLDERIIKTSARADNSIMQFDEFWGQYDSFIETDEKAALLKKALGIIVLTVLRMDGDNIDHNSNLQDLGVDSLMFVEIKNSLQALMGDRLVVSASTLKDCDTITILGDTLVSLIEGDLVEDCVKPTMQQVIELIREDCHLPEHISAKNSQQVKKVEEIRTVLLTGCTGNLGPHMIRELTSLPEITEVICLIRPKTDSVDQRLFKVLEGRGLLSQINMEKVKCIAGNVATKRLGMDEEIYLELSGKVDAIFHCAASVVHTQHYKKSKSQNDMRAVNIGGTKNILEFACEKKLKHVYHSATLLTATTIDKDSGRIADSWPEVEDYDNVTTLGYPVTKFVGDLLVKQAVERGIPVKAFRLPLIVGESDTGRCSIEDNHAILRYLFIMKTGIMPSNPAPVPALPVDICAKASVRLFFTEKLPVGIYNISNLNPDADQEFVNVAKRFGQDVKVVSFVEFNKRVEYLERGGGETAFSIFKDIYRNEEGMMGLYEAAPVIRSWVKARNEESIWISPNVEMYLPGFYEKHRPTMEYIYDDLLFSKKEGWFNKFGLH